MKILIVPLLLATLATPIVNARGEEGPVKVTLFYESYCPDCIDYILKKLYSAWTSFKGHISFDLVPFGNARQKYVHGHWEFDCQHGLKECQANKLHACAIHQLCGESGTNDCAVENLGPVMDFIKCLLEKPDQLKATKPCAQDAGVDGDAVLSCEAGAQGDKLLNLYGNQTLAFQPKIQYVPTVAINGKHDEAAEEDLIGEICKLRPELCRSPVPEVIHV